MAFVIVETEKTHGTGKRAGLIDYEITVRADAGALIEGPFRVPDWDALRFRNRLLNRLCYQHDEVRAVGGIDRA